MSAGETILLSGNLGTAPAAAPHLLAKRFLAARARVPGTFLSDADDICNSAKQYAGGRRTLQRSEDIRLLQDRLRA